MKYLILLLAAAAFLAGVYGCALAGDRMFRSPTATPAWIIAMFASLMAGSAACGWLAYYAIEVVR